VIHRDIKPGNIMITPSGDVKVTDFGIARVASNETVAQTAAVLGTASYLSPEQAQSQPVDGRTDIYSLGCVLYEMVTGRPPFLGDSAVAVASKQVLEQPVPPSRLNRDVSPDLDAVILRALAKNPDNRYQSAEEFRRDLERVRRGLPVEATPLLPAPAAAVGTTRVIQHDVAPAQRTAILEPEPVVEERSRWWIPVIVVLVILAILGAFLWILAHTLLNTNDNGNGNGNGNGNAAQVVVPDLNGQTVGDARSTLQQKGLNLVIGDRVPPTDPTQVPGTITSQDPAANIKVDKGSDVTVTIVGQPTQIAVPQLPDNSTVEQASALLTNAGLTPGDTRQTSSDTVPADQVIAFDPPSGTSVDPQTPVAIVVSSGPSQVTVPDVTCRSFSAAANILSHDGLTPSESPTTVGTNPTCPHGDKVASQDPAAGQVVDPGTTVTLFHGSEGQSTGPTATGPSA
jgi:serine/threonine-protein kinase